MFVYYVFPHSFHFVLCLFQVGECRINGPTVCAKIESPLSRLGLTAVVNFVCALSRHSSAQIRPPSTS